MATLAKRMIRTSFYVGGPFVHASNFAYAIAQINWRLLTQVPYVVKEFSVITSRFDLLIMRSVPLVAIATFSTGVLMTLQFSAGVERFGGALYVPSLVTLSIVKALGPTLACLLAASRAGGGLSAELASMTVTQQVDAISALGSDVDRKLIMPNLVTLMIGLPCLTLIADICGVFGGGFGAYANLDLPPKLILQKISLAISAKDLWTGVLKTVPQGWLIGLVSCHFGLSASGGTWGIGKATTSTIVTATILVVFADLILTKFLWLFP